MVILGIETSCDETACAVLKKDKSGIHILSNVVASSASLQAKYGGIIPEQAAREQIKSIIPVISEALQQANIIRHPELPPVCALTQSWRAGVSGSQVILKQVQNDEEDSPAIDAIAVTYGPGLIGSLLVGVETAKTLATVWNKPLIPINHLLGHFYANWIQVESRVKSQESREEKSRLSTLATSHLPIFPCLGLLVSGGHTDLVLFKDHGKYEYLGGTRDDAAGECFDKCARLLGLPYPGGPEISKLAQKGNPENFKLPIPLKGSKDLDFSYSGLKTAVSNLIQSSPVILNEVKSSALRDEPSGLRLEENLPRMRDSNKLRDPSVATLPQDDNILADLAASIEEVIVKSLIEKVILAIKRYRVEHVMVAGGVAANQKLQDDLRSTLEGLGIKLYIPPAHLCTDNAAMIASAAFFNYNPADPLDLQANPNLSL